jgi:ferredoxin-thioredoxin reductase catalytic subunit
MAEAISAEAAENRRQILAREAESGGYHLNPDANWARDLAQGLLVNEQRYGYPACPCRLATGNKTNDLDIICPCDYRDPDLAEHGACYCGLYVSGAIAGGAKKLGPIPERRPPLTERLKKSTQGGFPTGAGSIPVWRCKVCGYLCARESPPEICPICKAGRDRFEKFV